MLFPAERAFVWRDEKRAPLKTPAWEATFIREMCMSCRTRVLETSTKIQRAQK